MLVKLPKMLKKAPSARKILEAAIADIEDGQWLYGSWTEACAVKPQGCAMGLVAINARVPQTVGFFRARHGFIRASITPMADGNWPKSARKAAAALAATVKAPVKKARAYADEDTGILTDASIENIVIDYNDGGIKSRAALNWFNRALASLDA